ncbi:ABC transporter permease subunit [Niveispirillum sp. SYP-B3756]|uniref:ABC transporter permease n=1 Tax=Niveispirillum sp. SYP-B3756 TaxID=2662178 RepID=UPI0032B61FAF
MLRTALSTLLILIVWQVAAWAVAGPTLPGPVLVGGVLLREAAAGQLWLHLGITLARVAAAFILALSIGTAIGIAMGRSSLLDNVMGPWLTLALNVPALVVIVLAYLWFGLTEAAAIGAVAVNKIPNVVVQVRAGARALDPALARMAKAYRFSRWDRLRHLLLPHLQPYLFAAARNGLSLVWKIVLVVELLGRGNGVGFKIHLAFQLFDVASLLAYALAFVIVAQMIEMAVMAPLERRACRWRGDHG